MHSHQKKYRNAQEQHIGYGMHKILILLVAILTVNAKQIIDLDSCAFATKCTAACAGKPCGYKLPDPDNCLGYFVCLHDTTYAMHNCPYGQIFDTTARACVFGTCPQTGSCTPGTPSPGTPSPGTPSPGTPSPGTPSPGTPSPGTPTPGTPSPGTPSPGTPSPGTPSPGTPSPGTPSPGTPSPGTPSPGTPSPGTPSPGTPSTPSAECRPDCSNKEDGLLIGDLCNCRFFWQCLNRVAILRFCEKGMHWDRERFVCDFPYNVHNCDKPF